MVVLPVIAASMSKVHENRLRKSGLEPFSSSLRTVIISPALMRWWALSNVIAPQTTG